MPVNSWRFQDFNEVQEREKFDDSKQFQFSENFAQASRRNSAQDYEEDQKVVPRSADCNEGESCKGDNERDHKDEDFGFNGGGSLKKTSQLALKAAQEAQAAKEAQDSAGNVASKQAKSALAEKAIQAAKAAQAALAAKKAILDELERELREAEMVVQDLSSSIQQSEGNSQAALRAYQQAQTQLKMLTELIQVAQSTVGNAEQAAQGSQQELNEKTQLLEAAKNRVEKLLRELKVSRQDFGNTKKEAYKASMAAKEAKQNA